MNEHIKLNSPIGNNDLKLICPYHNSEHAKYVCSENTCDKKLLCQKCFDQIENVNAHKLIAITEYFKGMQNYVEMADSTENFLPHLLQIIEGCSLVKKKEYYVCQAEVIKDQLREEHVRNIRIQMDRFKNEVELQAKDHIIQSYEQKLADLFSNQSLKCKDFKDRGCKVVLSSVKSKNPYELNNNLIKLHQGKYELSFAKEQMFAIYSEINSKMENMISQNLFQIKEHMEEFTAYFGDSEKKQSILNKLKKSEKSNHKIQVSLLKSTNENDYQILSEFEKSPTMQSVNQHSSTAKISTPRNFVIKNLPSMNINNNNGGTQNNYSNYFANQPNHVSDEKRQILTHRIRGEQSNRDILEQNIFIPSSIRKIQHNNSMDFKSSRLSNSAQLIDSPLTPQQYQGSIFSSFLKRDSQQYSQQPAQQSPTTSAQQLQQAINSPTNLDDQNDYQIEKPDQQQQQSGPFTPLKIKSDEKLNLQKFFSQHKIPPNNPQSQNEQVKTNNSNAHTYHYRLQQQLKQA